MIYPRTIEEQLVQDNQMVGINEHLVLTHRILFLSGVIGGGMEFHNTLLALDSLSQDPIRIIITSVGGDLDATFLLYDTMKLIQSPVETIGRFCASAGALLLAGGSKRYLFPHARTMLHLPAGQMIGDAKDWDIQRIQMERYRDSVVDLLCDCGVTKSREEILTDIDRDFWMEPNEAIAYGLADEVLNSGTWAQLIKGGRK